MASRLVAGRVCDSEPERCGVKALLELSILLRGVSRSEATREAHDRVRSAKPFRFVHSMKDSEIEST